MTMTYYRVRYEIECDAETALEAAKYGVSVMRDADALAFVTVHDLDDDTSVPQPFTIGDEGEADVG
jgi:hypothetical protein